MTAPHYETITVEKKDQVDWLTLNRPESLNAINTPMVTELRDYFGGLMDDRDTRIVVLRGAGRAFSAVGGAGDDRVLRTQSQNRVHGAHGLPVQAGSVARRSL